MTQTFAGPDGQNYDFPDNMSMDDIKGVFTNKFGGPNVGNPPPATGLTPSSVPDPQQPSFMQRLLGSLGGAASAESTAMQDPSAAQSTKDLGRVFGHAITGGLSDAVSPNWDPSAGLGTTESNNALTEAARQRVGPVVSTLASGAGYALGPGGAIGRGASTLVGPTVAKFGGGVVPLVTEGTVMGGTQAQLEDKDPVTGAVIGGTSSLAGPIISKVLGKVAGISSNYLPTRLGGKEVPPTTAELQPAVPSRPFTPGSRAQNLADLSQKLDIIQSNAAVGGPSTGKQMSNLLQQDLDTGRSPLQDMGFDPVKDKSIFDAMATAQNASPIANLIVRKPIVAGGVMGIPAAVALHTIGGMDPEASVIGGGFLGEGASHLLSYLGAKKIANQSTGNAIMDLRRAMVNQPTIGPVRYAIDSDAARRGIQNLLLGGTLNR